MSILFLVLTGKHRFLVFLGNTKQVAVFKIMRFVRKRTNKLKLLDFGYILLAATFLCYYGKDNLYFANGAGGKDWKIGSPQVNPISAIPTRSFPELQKQALMLVNRDRQLNGLPPLVEDPLIALTAQKHALDMAQQNFYSHVNPQGQNPSDRYRANGGLGRVGENINILQNSPGIAPTYGLVEKFQRSWMYSEGHRQNLLNPNYTKFGFGIVAKPMTGEAYAVQNFQ